MTLSIVAQENCDKCDRILKQINGWGVKFVIEYKKNGGKFMRFYIDGKEVNFTELRNLVANGKL